MDLGGVNSSVGAISSGVELKPFNPELRFRFWFRIRIQTSVFQIKMFVQNLVFSTVRSTIVAQKVAISLFDFFYFFHFILYQIRIRKHSGFGSGKADSFCFYGSDFTTLAISFDSSLFSLF